MIVVPKPVVSDPQGTTVRQSLHALGFEEVGDVRVGKFIQLEVSGDEEEVRARVDEMCRRLLANAVIEDYRFELEPDAAPAVGGEQPAESA